MNWFNFVIILTAIESYCFFHSLLATIKMKKRVESSWPNFYHRFYRLLYNILAVISFVPVLFLVWWLESTPIYTIPTPWVYLTMLIQLTCAFLILMVINQTGGLSFLGLSQVLNPLPAKGRLVTEGFYRFVRHPIYTFGLIILWLVPVLNSNSLAVILGLTVYIVIGAKLEETRLKLEFPEYVEYQKRVPMLIPFLKLFS